MKLNRHNYEEYFILYLDNELDSEDRREVELFASEHPDLKAELDMLLQSKLTPDTGITFNNKESLLVRDSSAISLNNHEEWLLSYVDNELTTEEIKDVDRFIAEHPEVKTELGLLQKTKLQPEAIVFPDKESLYRKEEKAKVIAIHWKRWAVAAALLIGISTTAVVLLNNKSGGTNPGFAVNQSKTQTSTDNTTTGTQPEKTVPEKVTPANEQGIAISDPKKIETSADGSNGAVKQNSAVQKKNKNASSFEEKQNALIIANNIVKKKTNNLPDASDNPNVVNRQPDASGLIASSGTGIPSREALTNINEIAVTSKVTPGIVQTSYPSETPDELIGEDQPGKKNKLRGFFRKITRTFEKRTNIKATDDEDRLLIAGLAIKLN